MPNRDPTVWMWANACEMLERAERLQRQFFQLGSRASRQPVWEPPVDLFETERELQIVVALPGVEPDGIEVLVQGAWLIVAGERHIPPEANGAAIRRLEIPYGRFERHIELPAGHFEFARRESVHGCLLLALRKLT